MSPLTISLFYIMLWIKFTLKCAISMWIQSNLTMPRAVDDAAVGFYDDEIYIFAETRIIRYNLMNGVFIDDGTDLLSASVRQTTRFYAQIEDIMYFRYRGRFSVFNFSNKQFTENWNNIKTPVSIATYSCLSATDEYLFVLGGYKDGVILNTMQILHLLSTNWTLSYMNTKRLGLSCAIDRDRNTLYAIAGIRKPSPWTYVNSIEMVNISDIDIQSWSWINLNETLVTGIDGSRALLHQKTNRIFVIGGSGKDPEAYNYVHIINTVTNQVTLSSERLPYGVAHTAAIIIDDNILYGFGGWDGKVISLQDWMDTWFFNRLDNPRSTERPSNQPSSSTTNDQSPQPTAGASAHVVELTTTHSTDTNGLNPEDLTPDKSFLDFLMDSIEYIMVTLGSVLVCLLCCCGCLRFWKRRQQKLNAIRTQHIIQENHNNNDIPNAIIDEGEQIDNTENQIVEAAAKTVKPNNNRVTMPMVDDVAKDENELEEANSDSSDNFDEMFVGPLGEQSISKSDHNKAEETTEGAEDQKESFHGTKGDYYDEYHHQIYK
eukprot:48186_1